MARERSATQDQAVTRDSEMTADGMESIEPTHDEIALEAYGLWTAHGCPEGSEVDDWLEAERRLRDSGVEHDRSAAHATR